MMDWKQYEEEIYRHFAGEFPSARITRDTQITGRYSNIDRQIDVLIEDTIAGFHLRIAIDAKHRSRRIDVTDVEAFIGFCSDVGASKGVLISPKGYTSAAINRAHNDESDVELDVLNFSDLKQFQSFAAISHAGTYGVLLVAPFGWVIDGTMRKGVSATLYQRGSAIEKAGLAKEWMYVNFWSKTSAVSNLEELIQHQEKYLLAEFPNANITYIEGPRRERNKTRIRHFIEKSYPTDEYTGFVEFRDFIFFCILFSPEQLAKRNLRKLEFILRTVVPLKIKVARGASA